MARAITHIKLAVEKTPRRLAAACAEPVRGQVMAGLVVSCLLITGLAKVQPAFVGWMVVSLLSLIPRSDYGHAEWYGHNHDPLFQFLSFLLILLPPALVCVGVLGGLVYTEAKGGFLNRMSCLELDKAGLRLTRRLHFFWTPVGRLWCASIPLAALQDICLRSRQIKVGETHYYQYALDLKCTDGQIFSFGAEANPLELERLMFDLRARVREYLPEAGAQFALDVDARDAAELRAHLRKTRWEV